MRDLRSARLLEVIVHLLDTKKELEVSELPIPKGSDPQVFDYFLQRIQASLKDDRARTAKFESLDEEPAITFQALFQAENLTAGSQNLAHRLYDIMKQDGRISAGDLAVCRFDAEDEGERRTYLAVMKLDPTAALQQKRQHDSQGRLFVTFEVVQQMLPTQGEKLQKVAFIQNLEPRATYDMLLVDRQVRPAMGPRISQFFSQNFLNAIEAMTPEESTKLLVREAETLRRILKTELAPDETTLFNDAVNGALSSAALDLDSWVEGLDLPEKAKKKVERKLGPKHFPNRHIEIIQDVVRTEREKKRIFRGDHGLRLEMPAEFPPTQYRERTEREPGKFGGREFHVVTIETEGWREQR